MSENVLLVGSLHEVIFQVEEYVRKGYSVSRENYQRPSLLGFDCSVTLIPPTEEKEDNSNRESNKTPEKKTNMKGRKPKTVKGE